MKKIIFACVLCCFLVLVLSCASTKYSESTVTESKPAFVDARAVVETDFSEEEIAVYDFVIKSLLEMNQFRSEVEFNDGSIKVTKIPTSKVLLEDTTTTFIGSKDQFDVYIVSEKTYFEEKLGTEYSEAFDSYAEKNAVKTKVDSLFNVIEGIGSLSSVKAQIDPSARFEKYWSALYEVEPESCGTLALSNIGFNADGTKAVIQVEFHQGSMSGFIDYLLLTKTDSWQIENSYRAVYF